MVTVQSSQAGMRIDCDSCNASLTVPSTVGADNLFDDLFDEPSHSPEPVADIESEREISSANEESENELTLEHPVVLQPEIERSEIEKPEFEQQPDPTAAADDIVDDYTFNPLPPETKPEPAATTQDADPIAGQNLPEKTVETSSENENSDPFEYNENKALRVEGISPDVTAAEVFFFSCPVCDTDMHAREQEIGNQVVCTDCHSTVTVEKPKKKRKQNPWQQPARVKKQPDSDDEFKLEAPIERPKLEAGFGLESVAGDLLAPLAPEPEEQEKPRQKVRQKNRKQQREQTVTDNNRGNSSRQPTQPKSRTSSQPARKPSNSQAQSGAKQGTRNHERTGTGKEIKIGRLLELDLLSDLDLIIRSTVAILFLAFSYAMLDSVWNTLSDTELTGGERFVQYFPAAIGGFVCFVVVVWFMSVTMSVIMRSIANGDKKVSEWVGFAPSEWLGSFVAFAFAGWAASVPGGLIGYVFMKLTGIYACLPIMIALSVFALLPVMLISSFYNESAFNIFAPAVLQTTQTNKNSWTSAYVCYGLMLAAFVFGILILFIPSILFSFLGAAIQIAALTAFAVFMGLHAEAIVGGER